MFVMLCILIGSEELIIVSGYTSVCGVLFHVNYVYITLTHCDLVILYGNMGIS